MKKMLFVLLISTLGLTAMAQNETTSTTTTTTHRYYFYPTTNVYYDDVTGNYWYYDDPTTQWVIVKTLPTKYSIKKATRYHVDYNGDDPWKNNANDMKKYKVKSNGKIKAKPVD